MEKVVNCKRILGTMQYSNGDVYEGQWKNDDKTGYAKMTYDNGDKYEGQWLRNERNGRGLIL